MSPSVSPNKAKSMLIFCIIVRVFDQWTCNQTCFNAARALKPLNNGEEKPPQCVEFPPGAKVPGCDFCSPLDYTASGEFTDVQGSGGRSPENIRLIPLTFKIQPSFVMALSADIFHVLFVSLHGLSPHQKLCC